MNQIAPIGHNNPPDPIDEINATYESVRMEAENWLDGSLVENEAQMNAVNGLLAGVKEWLKALKDGQSAESKPHYDAHKAAIARWKPTIEDADRHVKGLVSAVDGYKRKLAAEKAEAERKARAEAERKMREAREATERAAAADLEAQRAAAAAQAEAEAAVTAAKSAAKDTVKGLRTVTHHEITDPKALLNWLARNRRDDVMAFLTEWARRNHKPDPGADGLRVWTGKEAF